MGILQSPWALPTDAASSHDLQAKEGEGCSTMNTDKLTWLVFYFREVVWICLNFFSLLLCLATCTEYFEECQPAAA